MIKVRLEQLSIGVKCPAATQDLELNTKNRDNAIQADYIQYGPLNIDEPGDYWEKIADHWDTTEEAAKKSLCGNCTAFDISPRMKECMPGETSDEDGELGYCHMHKFKCHSARSCRTWAKGGPIEDDDISIDWQTKGDKEEQLDEKRKKSKKKKGKKDRCYRIAKRKYDVFPSAYASGAIVKCRQGKIWKGIKEELIPGGLGAELTGDMEEKHKQIADKHSVSVKEIEDQIDKGTKVEMEHTSDPDFAHEIAMDHVIEDPKYYDKLIRLKLEGRKKKAGSESSKESSLRDWFKRKGAPGKKGGWVDCNTCRKDKKSGRTKCKPCGRQKGEKRAKYPSCRPTPGACKERGRGKSWGKKSAKGMKENLEMKLKVLINESADKENSKDVFNAEEFYKTALAMFKPPTELAGKLDTEERQFFQKYISDNIVGKTLPEKIQQLNSLMENDTAVDPEKTPINYILSSLGALKILQETIDDFNESTAGFTFEAFLSGLLGGKQVTERVGGSLPIEDCNFFVNPKTGEGGQPVSLKLLTGTGDTTSIEGSIPNLLDFFFRDQIAEVANERGIEYIVALKFSDKGLGIYSFNITPENFFNWVNPKYFDFDKMVIPSPDQLSEEKEKSLEDLISRFKEGVEELYPMLGLSSFEPNLELLRVLKSGDYKGSPSAFNTAFKQRIIPRPQFNLPAKLPKSRQEAARNFIDGLFGDEANTAYQKFMSLAGERLGPKYSKATELSDDLKEAWAQVREKPYSEWREVGTIIKRVFDNRYKFLKDLIEKVSPLEKASYNPILRHIGKFLGSGGEELEGEESIKMLIKTLGKSKDPKDIKKWSRILKSGVKATQFHIPARRVKQEGEDYGTLTFDKKAIFKIIEAYSDVLKVQVAPVYRAFAFLNQEINAYFIENKPGAAGDASKFAVELKQEVDKLPEIKSYAPPSPRIDYGDRQQIGTMSDVPTTAKARESKDPALKENKSIKLKMNRPTTLKENLQFHLENNIPMDKSVLRFGSDSHIKLIAEAKRLWEQGSYFATDEEIELFETNIGEFALYEGKTVALDVPMLNEEIIEEKKAKKKNPPLNKPTRNTGGGKKYKVFVRNPKTGGIKKVTFGDKKGGLEGNWNDPKARASFAKRHKCAQKKDKTKAGYWACRAHKYFGRNVPGRFW